jgi:hypothetical protein
VPFDDVLRVSTIPGKRELLDHRKARQQQSQQPNPGQELAMRAEAADIEKTQAETALTGAKARNEMLKPQIEAARMAVAAHQASRLPAPAGPANPSLPG